MKPISIDLETYSDVDLQKCGVYKYAQSENFEILLFGYSVDGGEVIVIDLAQGEKIPKEIIKALTDESIIKWAFNASFERVCLSEYLRKHYEKDFISYSIREDTVRDYLDPSSWRCSMIWLAYMGLPLSLSGAGAVLGLEEQKLTEGKDFSVFHVSLPRSMVEEPEICRSMICLNGNCLKNIINEMLKWRCPSRRNFINFPFLILYGMIITWIRKSMTEALHLIWTLSRMR